MESLLQDLRYGLRVLFKAPGFAAVMVSTLALGIGANSAIFSLVNAVLLGPLPFHDSDRLVLLRESYGGDWMQVSPSDFADWLDQSQVFEHIAAYHLQAFNLTGVPEPETIRGAAVSASLFPLLGVNPRLGRTFLLEEDQPGHNRVALISHGLWQRRFGSDPEIIGRSLMLNGQSLTIVGVLPRGFWFPDKSTELWVPIALSPNEAERGARYLNVIARLKPGVRLEQARSEMNTIARRLEREHPKTNSGVGVILLQLREHLFRTARPALLLLQGAAVFVLLIACANVANLLLARATVRQKEIAVRLALGADRLRLVRQLLTENLLLAMLGGSLGLLLACSGIGLLSAAIPDAIANSVPGVKEATVDFRVLGFTIMVSLLTGLVFGATPALAASKPDLNQALKEQGASTAGHRRQRLLGLLVVAEVTLALVLLVGSGLMIRNFLRLQQVDLGFDPKNVLTMSIALPDYKYREGHQMVGFCQRLLEGIEAMPGVNSVGLVNNLPLSNTNASYQFTVEGSQPVASGQEPSANYRVISPDYFRAMGIRLLKGRNFNEGDIENRPQVAIINNAMARRFWPDEDPIGKRLKLGGAESKSQWLMVVGVVSDVRHWLEDKPGPEIYLPYFQSPQRNFFLVVRTSSDPHGLAAAVRREVLTLDKDQPVARIRSLEQMLFESLAPWRLYTMLLGIFAGVALFLATVGIYGVISYSVNQRTHEIGIRVALGARQGDVLKLVLGRGVILTLSGLAIGLAGAFALSRVVSSALFLQEVAPTDPAGFAGAALLLVSVSLLASYIPAWRATRIDPMVALRYE